MKGLSEVEGGRVEPSFRGARLLGERIDDAICDKWKKHARRLKGLDLHVLCSVTAGCSANATWPQADWSSRFFAPGG